MVFFLLISIKNFQFYFSYFCFEQVIHPSILQICSANRPFESINKEIPITEEQILLRIYALFFFFFVCQSSCLSLPCLSSVLLPGLWVLTYACLFLFSVGTDFPFYNLTLQSSVLFSCSCSTISPSLTWLFFCLYQR